MAYLYLPPRTSYRRDWGLLLRSSSGKSGVVRHHSNWPLLVAGKSKPVFAGQRLRVCNHLEAFFIYNQRINILSSFTFYILDARHIPGLLPRTTA